MIRVLLIESIPAIREAVRQKLTESGEFEIAGEISCARDAMVSCEMLRPQLVLMNVETAENASGLEAAGALRERFASLLIVLCAARHEITYCERARQIGAQGYFDLSVSPDQILETLRAVTRGARCFPAQEGFPAPAGTAEFTQREKEILRHICRNETTAQIAAALYISENTVKFHKKNMLLKTGFPSCAEMAVYMLSRGYCNPIY